MIKSSSKIKISILINLFLKVFGMGLTFFIYSLSFKLFGSDSEYGVWLVILGIINWIAILDLGLGNGLRNNLSKAITNNSFKDGQKFVSTAYFTMFPLVILISLVILVLGNFIDWSSILNTDIPNIDLIVEITLILFVINLGFKLIEGISYSFQDAYIPPIIITTINVIFLGILFIGILFHIDSLYYVSISYGLVHISVYGIFNYILFSKKYKNVLPKYKGFDRTEIRKLFNLGIKFFMIQMMAIVVLSSDSFLTSMFLGPEHVPQYQIANKLFNVLLILSSIIMTPLWSAITSHFVKDDFVWIRKIIKRLILMFFSLCFVCLLLVVFSNKLIYLWMGPGIRINTSTIIFMAIMTMLMLWSNIFAYILNGMSKTNKQLIFMTIAALINIPLSYYCSVHLDMGVNGIILASIIAFTAYSISCPIEVWYVLRKR